MRYSYRDVYAESAAFFGQLGLLVRLEEQYQIISKDSMQEDFILRAAASGDLSVYEFVCSRLSLYVLERKIHYAVCGAARRGHINILMYIQETHPAAIEDGMIYVYAAERGQKTVMQWALDQGVPHEVIRATRALARIGYLEALKWAVAQNFPLDETVVEAAESAGFPAVADWCKGVLGI